MAGIFLFILIASLFLLVAGLIRPSIFQRIIKIVPKRKTIVLVFSVIIIVSFFGIGATVPPAQEEKPNNTIIENNNQTTGQQIDATDSPEAVIENKEKESAQVLPKDSVADQAVNNNPVQNQQPQQQTQKTDPIVLFAVSKVVDGDTIKISMDGIEETIRLIGIDTPETVDPRKPVQCFGIEASNKAKELLSGKKVRIEKDSTQGERDKYGRLLAYVFRDDGLFFNEYMVKQGYAHEYTYDTPYKYQAQFKSDEKYARENQLGLWSPSTCNGDTTSEDQIAPSTQVTGKYYTSSYSTSKYYYPEPCSAWQSLSSSYLKAFDSLEALLVAYPTRTLSPQCQ